MNYLNLIPFEVESIVKNTYEIPFGVKMIKAPEIWNDSKKGAGVVVAILDSGCQVGHPDLKGQVIGGKNFTTDSPTDLTDITGHGTHVAGTIAAIMNGQGIVGVAPEVSLLICKVVKRIEESNQVHFTAEYQDLINAIDYCINWRGPKKERVRVISMSLSGKDPSQELHEVIQKAVLNNILIVCAAGNKGDGNENTTEIGYPAFYNEVVCVGSVNPYKKLSKFTNTNDQIDLVAPGEEIWSTYPKNSYAKLRGTSMATPHVAGAAALIINQCERDFGRPLLESEIFAQLIKRTTPLGYSKNAEGNGLLVLTEGYTSQ